MYMKYIYKKCDEYMDMRKQYIEYCNKTIMDKIRVYITQKCRILMIVFNIEDFIISEKKTSNI